MQARRGGDAGGPARRPARCQPAAPQTAGTAPGSGAARPAGRPGGRLAGPGWRRPSVRLRRQRGRRRSRCSICCRPGPSASGRTVALLPRAARRLKSGGWGADRDYAAGNLAAATAKFVRPEDALIGRLLTSAQHWSDPGALPQAPDTVDLLLERVLATGRCHWASKDGPVLGLGSERPGGDPLDARRPGRAAAASDRRGTGLGAPARRVALVCRSGGGRGRPAGGSPGPGRRSRRCCRHRPSRRPRCRSSADCWPGSWAGFRRPDRRGRGGAATCRHGRRWTLSSERLWAWSQAQDMRDLALLRFDYDGALIGPGDQRQSLRRAEGNRVVVVPRQLKAERAAERRLHELGLRQAPAVSRSTDTAAGKAFTLQSTAEVDWWQLVHRGLPAARGGRLGDRHRPQLPPPGGGGGGRLGGLARREVRLVVLARARHRVGGERVPLLPVLAQAVRHARPAATARAGCPRATPFRPARRRPGIALPRSGWGRCWRRWSSCTTPGALRGAAPSTSRWARPRLWPSSRRPCTALARRRSPG